MFNGRLAIAVLGSILLTGCAWLPAAGPTAGTVVDEAQKDGVQQYIVVDVDNGVLNSVLKRPAPTFQSVFGADRQPPPPTLAVGDSIIVSIWEAGGGSLFATAPTIAGITETGSRQATIPEQMVQPDGTISMPFAGRMAVMGKTPQQLEESIRQNLAGKAIDPQVMVAITHSLTNSVTVTGQVIGGARVPISPKGDHILDVIASAGGVKSPIYETFIRLTRNGVTATIPFSLLVSRPQENIFVWPGDVLTVVQQQQNFVAVGATGRNAEIPFDQETVTVMEALGKSSGLLDDRADASGVFVLRYESKSAVGNMSVSAGTISEDPLPVVYRFNLKDLNAYFMAQRFPVENKDIIYVANANSNSIQKFFGLLSTLTGPIVTGAVVKNSVP